MLPGFSRYGNAVVVHSPPIFSTLARHMMAMCQQANASLVALPRCQEERIVQIRVTGVPWRDDHAEWVGGQPSRVLSKQPVGREAGNGDFRNTRYLGKR